jgi:hypothetical protein
MLAEKGHWPPKNGKDKSVIVVENMQTMTIEGSE